MYHSPLFSIVTAQTIQASSVSATVTSSEPLMMSSALPSLPLSTATVVSSESEVPTTIPPTQHTRAPTSSGLTAATTAPTNSLISTALPVPNPSPSVSNGAPPNLSDSTNSSAAVAVTVVVSVIVLLSTAAIGVVVFILCMRRKTNRKEQTASGSVSKQQQTRSSFFDNPVYDHVQQQQESNGYSSIVDPIYLGVPAGHVGTGRGLDTVGGDGDSGYAEPGRIIVTPSHSATPTPVPSSPLHVLPSPSPHPTTHTYHTLEQSQLPQDYIEPQPSSRASGDRATTTPDASNLDIHRTIHRKTIDHEYHELDPNTGVSPVHCV